MGCDLVSAAQGVQKECVNSDRQPQPHVYSRILFHPCSDSRSCAVTKPHPPRGMTVITDPLPTCEDLE